MPPVLFSKRDSVLGLAGKPAASLAPKAKIQSIHQRAPTGLANDNTRLRMHKVGTISRMSAR